MNAALGIGLYLLVVALIGLGSYLAHKKSNGFADPSATLGCVLAIVAVVVALLLPLSLCCKHSGDRESIKEHEVMVAKLAGIDALEDEKLSKATRILCKERIDRVNKAIQRGREVDAGIFDAWSNDALAALPELE